MAGIDEYAKLVLHCDGADESQTFTDSSDSAHTVTAEGTAQIDTAQKVFGTGSGLFDGNSDYLTVPNSDDWKFGLIDFCIDMRVKFNALSTYMILAATNYGAGWLIRYDAPTSPKEFLLCVNGTFYYKQITLVTDTWYHIALSRVSGYLRLFVDGTQVGSTETCTANITGDTTFLHIGKQHNSTNYMNGWIDELRISKGDGRWSSNFTPPTEAYSAPGWAGKINGVTSPAKVNGVALANIGKINGA